MTVASGKTFAVTPAVRVSRPSGGKACAVDLRATTRARVKVHRAFVWRTITVSHVHFTLGAGRTRVMSFKLTRQGAAWLTSRRTLKLTVTTTATVTGAKAAKLVKTITARRPAPARRK